MIELFPLEFWMTILFVVNFILVIFLFLFVKRMNRLHLRGSDRPQSDTDENGAAYASGSAAQIIDMLEPLVKESRNTALSFDKQIKQKKQLIRELNDALDSRIISINLLLSRADALQHKLEERQYQASRSFFPHKDPDFNSSSTTVMDQQNQILDLYHQDLDVDKIAQQLSIPKGEVQLVIDLKKKFVAMEKNSQ